MYSQEEAKPEAVYWYLHKRVPLTPSDLLSNFGLEIVYFWFNVSKNL
jgi:hypothetical protein